ncbi:hypothetical protein JCM24511_01417 [Saitozyma sp. JCM 24511]|nr:hypothetical protein JCM24511_01417 [Saitozyma sp. JCM 24511]
MTSTPLEEKTIPPTDLPAVEEVEQGYVPAKVHWYRGTTAQTIIVGVASFLAPGAYAALAATGAGGLADITWGNASSAIAYGLIVPSALISTGCLSKIGPRWTLAIGACGYAPYAAALYANSAFRNQWGLVVGAIVCGLTSGLFWVSEGAIIMIYSEPERKGRLLALWQSIYQAATLIGGGINLGLNVHNKSSGGLAPKTYLTFVGLNCLAPFVSLLLSNPKQVQRVDKKPVPAFPSEGFWKECWLTCKELKDPKILACAFLWSQCLFIPSYLGTYVARFFSVRARGLTSIVQPLLAILFFQIAGVILDSKKIKLRHKLIVTWGALQVLGITSMIWILVKNVHLDSVTPRPNYDWTTPGFAAAWVPAQFARAVASTNYGYNYYMATWVFPRQADGARISRIIATLRSAESGSAAIAFGIAAAGLPLHNLGYINIAFLILTTFLGAYILQFIWVQDKAGVYDKPPAVSESQSEVEVN